MNATARMRRADSLYYDRITRRGLCDEVALLEHENSQLRMALETMLYCTNTENDCDGCSLNDGHGGHRDESSPLTCDSLHSLLKEVTRWNRAN